MRALFVQGAAFLQRSCDRDQLLAAISGNTKSRRELTSPSPARDLDGYAPADKHVQSALADMTDHVIGLPETSDGECDYSIERLIGQIYGGGITPSAAREQFA